MTLALSIKDVSIKFGDFVAIKKVSLKVQKNEVRFFIGPNGAGKTTILDAICGNAKVASGHIEFTSSKGVVELSNNREYKIQRDGVGRKFQAPTIFPGLTVYENLELAVANSKGVFAQLFSKLNADNKKRIEEILDLINLSEERDRMPLSLSHGQKQWLEIGMLVVTNSELILLDEPVAGLSRSETQKTTELIHKLKENATVIVVEHDMQFAADTADKVTVFHEGEVLAEGDLDTVKANPKVMEVYLGRGK